ncbi:esterase/lipase [Trueperella bonasi]|uniref:Esterase/lipase n=1 Tax=Trueperella bonasi TaxID=312286 RepID=A0ABT9NG79_9ACTO|nr:hypothetical protein [Trueperella bonasi]MDP9805833.1 esterase/lipase [Trueperella bonasi]
MDMAHRDVDITDPENQSFYAETEEGKLHGAGVVFAHGFGQTPAVMRPWAKYWHTLGASVGVPVLPGHGTSWQDMSKTP